VEGVVVVLLDGTVVVVRLVSVVLVVVIGCVVVEVEVEVELDVDVVVAVPFCVVVLEAVLGIPLGVIRDLMDTLAVLVVVFGGTL